MKVAIITGASSGMGAAFAERIDKTGEADEIWAVARRKDRLEQLAQRLKTPVRTLELDLAESGSVQTIRELLERERPEVSVLVNAAGFGKIGNCLELTEQQCSGMLDVNCRALMNLTLASVPYCTDGSRIIQIASSASFQPLPGLDVYAATKAFVRYFTRALRWELAGRGIRMTAVCPGWVRTEFVSVAKDSGAKQVVRHFLFPVSANWVVSCAWLANTLNLPVATCGLHTLIQRLAAKLLPSWFIMGCWEMMK